MSKCTKANCPMNARTVNPDCDFKGCPWRTEQVNEIVEATKNAMLVTLDALIQMLPALKNAIENGFCDETAKKIVVEKLIEQMGDIEK